MEPARVFALPAGTLRRGEAADIAIIDPNLEWKVDPAKFFSKGKNTPLAGVTFRGKVVMTLVGGETVYVSAEC